MASYPELRGKSAIVTGASAGIGKTICLALAEQGINVLVNGKSNRQAAEKVAAAAREKGVKAVAELADVTRSADVAHMVSAAVSAFGQVDILINNAGGFPQRRLVVETPDEEWDEIINLNLRSAFLCSKAVLPGMLERHWGRIINVSSEVGRMPIVFTAAHYAAGKAGMLGFTRHLSKEVAGDGITVNATCPGTTYTDRVRRIYDTQERIEGLEALTPIGRLGEPEEQTGTIVFLCSDAASYITGATIDVSGGKIMM
jgi:NAD(P)-dependent dehydrogenase (short-subunit alcohol dehydrogenase family)